MATDSTELSFVRCPACRSLVPAVSTRCRMCGATLDESQKGSDQSPSDLQKSGRVRQRTMTQPESDFMAAADQVREEAVEESQNGAPDDDTSDVVGDEFIDSMDTGEDQVSAVESSPGDGSAVANSGANAVEHSGAENGKAIQNGDSYTPAVNLKSELESEIDKSADPLSDYIEEVSVEEELGAKSSKQDDFSAKKEKSREDKPAQESPRVVIESGSRKGHKSGLSFGKSAETSGKPDEESSSSDNRRSAKDSEENSSARGDTKDERREEKKRDRSSSYSGGSNSPNHSSSKTKRQEGGEEKLFGWLVSYSNPKGEASELREGRFFISQTAMRDSDFIVDDSSVSNPHALVNLSNSEGFKVQDLMSERGVFVRRRGTGQFQRISDTVKLDHGDWIRFGEVEYLVCLVAAGKGSKD